MAGTGLEPLREHLLDAARKQGDLIEDGRGLPWPSTAPSASMAWGPSSPAPFTRAVCGWACAACMRRTVTLAKHAPASVVRSAWWAMRNYLLINHEEGRRHRCVGRASNPADGATRRRVGSTPISFLQDERFGLRGWRPMDEEVEHGRYRPISDIRGIVLRAA